jgi:2-polyprenyl-3-methyl-5-hydroxy-6-metoxy-1,4-benzoquinol methylase
MQEDAETYDSYLVPAIFEPWSRDLIKRALVWKGDRVLDVACGTGIVACRIAGTGAKVTGLDTDASRLEVARKRADDESVRVTWREGSGEALPFRAPEFELVTCQQGLQFMTDRAKAAREMRRVLVPGGRAVVSCWLPVAQQGAYAAIDAVATRHLTSPRETSSPIDHETLNQLLLDAKFFAIQIETVTRQVRVPDPARFAALSLAWLTGAPASEAIVAEGVEALTPFVDGDALQFKMSSLVAVARVKA